MEIRFKTRKTGEISALDYNEFKDRILKGEVLPQDEVQDRILTNNEWRTVDILRIFHDLSPSRYPSGPHLAARERAEAEIDRRTETRRIQAAEQQALAREFFQRAYPDDSTLVHLYQFLTECRELPLTRGEFAVRFTYLPSFHAPVFVRASQHVANWELTCKAGNRPAIHHLPLAPDDAQRLVSLAEAVNLNAMPADDDIIGLDGSTWALEVSRAGSYALRHRWSPTDLTEERGLTEFVGLGRYMLNLSGLKSGANELS